MCVKKYMSLVKCTVRDLNKWINMKYKEAE